MRSWFQPDIINFKMPAQKPSEAVDSPCLIPCLCSLCFLSPEHSLLSSSAVSFLKHSVYESLIRGSLGKDH